MHFEEVLADRVGIDDPAVLVDHGDHVRGVLDHGTKKCIRRRSIQKRCAGRFPPTRLWTLRHIVMTSQQLVHCSKSGHGIVKNP